MIDRKNVPAAVGLLASVTNLEEARLAVAGGADIVDLKNPAAGALGALPLETVRTIAQALHGRRPVSATVGDLPMEPEGLAAAVAAMGSTGVDYVKIGFFAGGDWQACLEALMPLARRYRLIAVLFADQKPDFRWVAAIARAGFAGAMLDTQDKARGSLRQVMGAEALAEFVQRTQDLSLLCGLAGSLRENDISVLAALEPDYLGFRGALCAGCERTARLDAQALARVRRLVERDAAPA